MERWTLLKLIKEDFEISPIGEPKRKETISTVYGLISSVSSSEWFNAQRNDINARYRVRIYSFEYNDQTFCELDNTRYKIYKTYEVDETYIELYLEEKVGDK